MIAKSKKMTEQHVQGSKKLHKWEIQAKQQNKKPGEFKNLDKKNNHCKIGLSVENPMLDTSSAPCGKSPKKCT